MQTNEGTLQRPHLLQKILSGVEQLLANSVPNKFIDIALKDGDAIHKYSEKEVSELAYLEKSIRRA